MTQEQKELLLQDLSARLPYGVKGHYKYYDIIGGRECLTDENDGNITAIDVVLGNPIKINKYYIEVEYVKPYLRPMSSMTEREKDYFNYLIGLGFTGISNNTENLINWLNRNMFDYRDLISLGLVLEAPEEMYRKEEKI